MTPGTPAAQTGARNATLADLAALLRDCCRSFRVSVAASLLVSACVT
jgi:hypothetical protein